MASCKIPNQVTCIVELGCTRDEAEESARIHRIDDLGRNDIDLALIAEDLQNKQHCSFSQGPLGHSISLEQTINS